MIRRIALAALLFLLAPSAANAAQVTCTLSGSGVAFGSYSGSQLTSSGAIVITCTGNGKASYTLALSTGSSGTYASRQMRRGGGANTLSYNLFQDAAFSLLWGDGTGGSTIVSGSIHPKGGDGIVTVSVPVYGKLPAQPTPAPGNYSDTIVATLVVGGDTETASFLVTANVGASCAIIASNLQFFSYTGSQKDAQSQIVVACANSIVWNVGLNQGTSPGATVTTRKMTGSQPAAFLPYGLFRNSSRTLNWGNTVGTDTQAGTGTGSAQVLTVYGRIPASQPPLPGGYEDTITATLTF